MAYSVHSCQLDAMSPVDITAMFRLRYDAFFTRLGWQVSASDGLERDAFDSSQTTYILGKASNGRVDACWRLLPSMGSYMLKDVFPELLHGIAAPAARDIWELSRFAVATERVSGSPEGFGPLSVALMAEAARFALRNGIIRYVTVTTVAIERLLKRQGLNIHRVGPPIRIGIALTVACIIEVDGITLDAVGVSRYDDSN